MPVSTSPVKILLDLEIDLDNLSSEENYLSALIEATNMLSISNSGDGRIPILQEEIKRVRGERVPAIKERRTRISAASLLGRSANKEPQKLLSASKKMVDRKRMISSSFETIVSFIAEKLTSIESTLLEKQKLEKKNTESNRKILENLGRGRKEDRLEQEQQTGFLTGAAKKILEPVQGVLGRIFKFITTLILAKAFINILKWFGDPANKKKIDSLVKFFSANWGKLLSAYLVFGTGLGRFVQFLTRTLISGAIKLTALTAKLLAAKGVKGARGFARAFSGARGNKLARGLQVVGTAGAVLGMGGMFQGMDEGGSVTSQTGEKINTGTPDTQLTALQPGEFVMSKGAVQKFGVDVLQSMNAMGGGSGVPKMMDNIQFASDGGVIGYRDGGRVIRTSGSANLRGGKVVSGNMSQSRADYVREKLRLESERFEAISIYGFNSPEVNQIRKQILILNGVPERAIVIPRGKGEIKIKGYSTYSDGTDGTGKERGGGFGRAFGGFADFATLGMFDFDNQNRKGAPKDFGIRRIAGGLTDALTFGLTDFDKRGSDKYMQLDPMFGGRDKAWGSRNEQAKRREKQSGFGLKRGIGGLLDFATLGMFDFDKMNRRGAPKGFGLLRILGGLADVMTAGATDFDKRGAGIGQMKLGEMMSNRSDRRRRERSRSGMAERYAARRGISPRSTNMSSRSRVSGRFDMKTGKAYINDQEVSMNEYLNYYNMSKQEKLRVYGQRYNEGGMVEKDYSGNLSLLGGRSLGSISDLFRFGGEDFIYKGLKEGITYDPAFTGAAPKALGGKKIMDMLPFGMGKNVPNYASQYFTPELDTAMRYAGEGGSVVQIPRTKGVRGFKNLFGSNISRGFDPRDVEQLVKTSDTIGLDKAGLTKTFDLSNKATKESLKNAALKQGSKKGFKKLLGRLVPGVSIGLSAMDAKNRLSRGDQFGAALSGVSAIPGPLGWLGLAGQLAYDATINPFNKKPKQMAEGGYTGPMTTPNIKAPVGQPTMSAPKVTVLPSRQTVNNQSGGQYGSGVPKIPQINVGNGSSRKKKQLGITV